MAKKILSQGLEHFKGIKESTAAWAQELDDFLARDGREGVVDVQRVFSAEHGYRHVVAILLYAPESESEWISQLMAILAVLKEHGLI